MDSGLRLSLFGVIHNDSVGKVTEELDDVAADVDAIFIEYPDDPSDLGRYLTVLIRAPAFLLGVAISFMFLQGPLFLLFGQDLFPSEYLATQEVSKRRDLPVHAIDDHPVQRAQDAGPTITLFNWMLVVPVFVYGPITATATATVLLGGAFVPILLRRAGHRYLGPALLPVGVIAAALVVAFGYASLSLLLAGTVAFAVHLLSGIGERNETMLDRVERISTDEDYDDAVLVTGKGHLAGLVRDAADRPIEIPTVHVSFWRDSGTTHHAPFSDGLPELGFGGVTAGELVRAFLTDDLPRYGRRIGAGFVDGLFVVVCWVVATFVGIMVLLAAGVQFERVQWPTIVLLWLLTPVGYHTLLEGLWGTTPGKRLLGLAVATTDGAELSWRNAVIRNLTRPVDFTLLYLFSGIAVMTTSRDQSVGDVLAGTKVRPRDELFSERAMAGDGADDD